MLIRIDARLYDCRKIVKVQWLVRLFFAEFNLGSTINSFAITWGLWVILELALECLQTDKSLSRFPQTWSHLVVFGVHVRLTESLKNHRCNHLEPMGSRPAW